MKTNILICAAIVSLTGLCGSKAQTSNDPSLPHLSKQGTATQLVVDGKPFLVLGAELNNSSASSLEYMKPLWPKLVAAHLNTVLATVTWELIEPQEGRFDFNGMDGLLQQARANDLHLVLLWFGSWKNGKSTYQPLWVKTDQKRFPLACSEDGKSMPILTTLSDANRNADARAFAALMRHLREVDGQNHTVLMIQVENEAGILGDTRDYSPAANAAFAGPVPKELIAYLVAHKDTLASELRNLWATNGFKTSGTWTEVFGPGKPAGMMIPVRTLSPPLTEAEHETGWRNLHWPVDEIFMAWNYAHYIGSVAAAGKAEYDIPLYVNAWLQQRDHAWPGTYPSGGPLPQVHDIWRAGAPAIDILAPDLYVPEFEELCARFTRSGNPLFIPESRAGEWGMANAIYAIGTYNAIGYSPFGVDRLAGSDLELARTYDFLTTVSPVILANQGQGTMTAVLVNTNATQSFRLGNYNIEAKFWNPPFYLPATNALPERVAGLFISTGPDDYIVIGRNLVVYFSSATDPAESVGLGTVEEGVYQDGRWVPGRRLNGDETPEWKALRFPSDHYSVQHVKLYQYR
jgi:beta-galactosidase GanA